MFIDKNIENKRRLSLLKFQIESNQMEIKMQKNKDKAIPLLESWLNNNNSDDIAEQKKSLSKLKKSIDEDRTSYRKLYKGDNIMNEKEESGEKLQKEIFEVCKKENRQPDSAEIIVLSNIEEQRFFDKMCPGVDKILEGRAKAITKKLP